jgi:hypothetical protein
LHRSGNGKTPLIRKRLTSRPRGWKQNARRTRDRLQSIWRHGGNRPFVRKRLASKLRD